MQKTTAVILAAGMGTRMKTKIPKVLHKVGSKALITRVVDSLKVSGVDDIIAVVGYKSELVEALFGNEIKFVKQEELLGSGDALKKAMPQLVSCNTVLVTCGDAPLLSDKTFSELLAVHEKEKASCTFLTSIVPDPFAYGRVVRDESSRVVMITEEKDASEEEKAIKEINVGTYCFNREMLEKYIDEIKINEKKKEFYLTDIVGILREKEEKIETISCEPEDIVGINSRKELAMVNNILNKRTLDKLMDSGVTIVDPGSTFIDESVEVGQDTIIYPCTVIEKDVKIDENCKIGPFARLRPGSQINSEAEIGNYVEICRSVVGERSKVKHHTYLGDTIVGKDVNIGAGTITANYDGKNKHQTIIEDGCFIGIGVSLIAPVKIGKGAKVGAGSVVTKNKNVSAGSTVAGVPAKILETN